MKMVFEYHGTYKNKQSNQIWTHENHAEHIFSDKFIEQKLDYIHNNPVKAGKVAKSPDYLYTSTRNYADRIGLLSRFVFQYALQPQAAFIKFTVFLILL